MVGGILGAAAALLTGCAHYPTQEVEVKENTVELAELCRFRAETLGRKPNSKFSGTILTTKSMYNPLQHERETQYAIDWSDGRFICLKVTYHNDNQTCSIKSPLGDGLDARVRTDSFLGEKFCRPEDDPAKR